MATENHGESLDRVNEIQNLLAAGRLKVEGLLDELRTLTDFFGLRAADCALSDRSNLLASYANAPEPPPGTEDRVGFLIAQIDKGVAELDDLIHRMNPPQSAS